MCSSSQDCTWSVTVHHIEINSKKRRAQANATFSPRTCGGVKAAGHGIRLLSEAAAPFSDPGRSERWEGGGSNTILRPHSSGRAACFPSSLLQTSDGKIVRQLLTSINNQTRSSIRFQFSHTLLGQMEQPGPGTPPDGAASAGFKKEGLLSLALQPAACFSSQRTPKPHSTPPGNRTGPLAAVSKVPVSREPILIPSLLPWV